MGNRYFTDEQRILLEENPYVDKVSHKAITYSEAFKQHFSEERNQGRGPTEIFREAGFDTDILGKERIKSFSKRIQKMQERMEGFQDLRSERSGRSRTKERTQEEEILYLKHKIELQKQQIEALKKTNFIHRKVKQASRKKNSNSSKT